MTGRYNVPESDREKAGEIHRYKLCVEFNGAGFHGWQYQDDVPSVQGAIEDAIKAFCGQHVRIHCAGRTDTGVHGLAMVAHADLPKDFPAFKVREAINFHLKPHAIVILDAVKVDENFHARYSAKKRYYRYHIINRPAPLSLRKNQAWQVRQPLDVEAMYDAAQELVGLHDFTTFRSSRCQSDSPVKSIDEMNIWREGDDIYIETSAMSFLHHQVRSMVGCLYLVGRGRWTKADLKAALDAADRKELGYNAPPDGLYFVKVDY
jgi:tRNA pseudouridine38-40 synthase